MMMVCLPAWLTVAIGVSVVLSNRMRTGGAVKLDQRLESRRRRTALRRQLEIDLDQHRGAANALVATGV